ncbi:MAG: CvpA family protein [Peptococcaceae bacterium MAG4]|nr:CvpA family protein [Peptococcaceae bacterium MAG4]
MIERNGETVNWLDWMIVIIIVLSALGGLRSGFLKSVAGLAGMVIGLVVAFAYHRPLAAYLTSRWNVQDRLQPMLEKFLKNLIPGNETLTYVSYPESSVAALPVASNPLNPLGDQLMEVFTSGILEVLCFLILLFATLWGASLVGSILNKIANFSFLGLPNHLGGFLFGLVRGIIIVMVILMLMSPFQRGYVVPGGESGSPGISLPPGKAFQDSVLLPYFEPIFDAIQYPLPGSSKEVQDELWQVPVTEANKDLNRVLLPWERA